VIYAWVPFNNFIGFVPDLLVLLLLQGEYCAYAALPGEARCPHERIFSNVDLIINSRCTTCMFASNAACSMLQLAVDSWWWCTFPTGRSIFGYTLTNSRRLAWPC